MERVALPVGGHAYLRVRQPQWANPFAYARVSVLNTTGERFVGPWLHLFDRSTQALIGEPTPQAALIALQPAKEWFYDTEFDLYTGPLDLADDTQATNPIPRDER